MAAVGYDQPYDVAAGGYSEEYFQAELDTIMTYPEPYKTEHLDYLMRIRAWWEQQQEQAMLQLQQEQQLQLQLQQQQQLQLQQQQQQQQRQRQRLIQPVAQVQYVQQPPQDFIRSVPRGDGNFVVNTAPGKQLVLEPVPKAKPPPKPRTYPPDLIKTFIVPRGELVGVPYEQRQIILGFDGDFILPVAGNMKGNNGGVKIKATRPVMMTPLVKAEPAVVTPPVVVEEPRRRNRLFIENA